MTRVGTACILMGLTVFVSCARVNKERISKGSMLRGLPLVFNEDFEQGSSRWRMTDPNAWKLVDENGNSLLALYQAGKYKPPVQSPLNIALVEELEVTDFVLDARMKQTGRDYDHRDLCLFFGYQDASHFYYVHLAKKADAHANSIFLVNNEPRVSIATERTEGTDWGHVFHMVRVARDTSSGTIEVFFDDLEHPVMRAVDKTFLWGSVGLGSFDDVGLMDDVRVWGTRIDKGGDWQSLFDGRTLDGWIHRGGKALFEAREGTIAGTTVPNTPNSFLCTEKHYGDFVLELEAKVDPSLNSGIQIRSNSIKDYKNGCVHGYQVEIDPSDRAWSGGIYDESRRGWLCDLKDNESARMAFKKLEWNHYRILAIGDSFRTWVNGVPAADLKDSMTPSGFIALQVHGTQSEIPLQVQWRNIRIIEMD